MIRTTLYLEKLQQVMEQSFVGVTTIPVKIDHWWACESGEDFLFGNFGKHIFILRECTLNSETLCLYHLVYLFHRNLLRKMAHFFDLASVMHHDYPVSGGRCQKEKEFVLNLWEAHVERKPELLDKKYLHVDTL